RARRISIGSPPAGRSTAWNSGQPQADIGRAMPQVKVQDALRLAQQHRDARRFREAETIYREIIAQRPDHAESHHPLGLLAYQEGRHAEALEPLRRAIALK